MRIIHGIHSKETFQATVGGDLYRGCGGKEGEYQGWRCEVLIVTTDTLLGENEPIYIEGSASDIRFALSSVLAMIDDEEERMRQRALNRASAQQATS
jgi:hypothetical protein